MSAEATEQEATRRERVREEDAALMHRVVAREDSAFTELYQRLGQTLYALAFKILGDAREAEDVIQEAFLQMWKRAETYDARRSSLFTWAVMITRHKAIDRLRTVQRHRRDVEVVGAELTAEESVDAASGHEQTVFREDAGRVREALAQLPAEQREAIQLAFFSGLSHSDVAAKLASPLGTIKARIRRGLLNLQNLMTGGAE